METDTDRDRKLSVSAKNQNRPSDKAGSPDLQADLGLENSAAVCHGAVGEVRDIESR